MESPVAQAALPPGAPIARRRLPSLQLALTVLAMAVGLAVFLVWGWDWGNPPAMSSGLQPTFRYVNSGWVSPHDWQEFGPFSNELRAAVIVNQDELDAFQGGFVSKVNRGTTTSLGRIDFETSVLLAAYYIWRPVKGDPLSVTGVVVEGERATVLMDLNEDAQGREFGYLYAPMVVVAVERSLFPGGKQVEFVFELEGHPRLTLFATPN